MTGGSKWGQFCGTWAEALSAQGLVTSTTKKCGYMYKYREPITLVVQGKPRVGTNSFTIKSTPTIRRLTNGINGQAEAEAMEMLHRFPLPRLCWWNRNQTDPTRPPTGCS